MVSGVNITQLMPSLAKLINNNKFYQSTTYYQL